jgi:hypothetical protein
MVKIGTIITTLLGYYILLGLGRSKKNGIQSVYLERWIKKSNIKNYFRFFFILLFHLFISCFQVNFEKDLDQGKLFFYKQFDYTIFCSTVSNFFIFYLNHVKLLP